MSKDKFLKGEFHPKNPKKYIGKRPITYRSGWELKAMEMFDTNPYILAWESESREIPYFNPFKPPRGAWSVYIPDFIVIYMDPKTGKQFGEMMEVKPLKETPGHRPISERTGRPLKISAHTKAAQALNEIKWKVAKAWCDKNGLAFRVVTEQTLFRMNMNK